MAHSTKLISCLLLVTWATCVITDEMLKEVSGVKREVNSNEHKKVKRSVGKKGFNQTEIQEILYQHNQFRRRVKASNMAYLTWSAELEKSAQKWANKCKFVHSDGEEGENLHANTEYVSPDTFIEGWYDENEYYTYSNGDCEWGEMCGHYTQVVWADTEVIGCGVKYCSHIKEIRGEGYFYVCQYLPPGNMWGEKPFKKGRACSKCPPNTTICDNGLCA